MHGVQEAEVHLETCYALKEGYSHALLEQLVVLGLVAAVDASQDCSLTSAKRMGIVGYNH